MSFPKPRTLRGRLTLWYTAVLAIVLLAFGGTTYVVAMQDEGEEVARGEAAEPVDRRLLLALGVGFPAALIVAVAGGLWLSRRALSPIDEVVRVAGSLDANNLALRIPNPSDAGEEVQRLAAALNAMLERIERSIGGLRRFTADAAHELRTPITALMGNLEVALRKPREAAELRDTMGSALEELARLTRLVESLLTLARSDAGELPLQNVQIDVGEIVRDALAPYHEFALERRVSLVADYDGAARVAADPLWLGRALANLIDNACKFTPQGGHVAVKVHATNGRVRIAVEDDGPGLSADERARAFERFYRGEATRGTTDGFGLGLPLAREIIEAMGGALVLESRASGGTIATVELPCVGAALG
jgi:heavy metal sensor kinase